VNFTLYMGCRIVFKFLFALLSWYHLPCICNSLELESVILHGICYIWQCVPSILHCISYIWPCLLSILHGSCHMLALQLFICMAFATFYNFKRSCGFFEGFRRFSFRISFRVSCKGFFKFHLYSVSFRVSLGLRFHWCFFRAKVSLEFHSGQRFFAVSYLRFLIRISYQEFYTFR